MSNIEGQFDAFAGILETLEIVSLAFLFLIGIETFWDIATGKRKKLSETFANFAISVGNFLLERTIFGLVFILGLFAVAPLALFQLPLTWWSWVLALIAADLSYYWMHRLEHKVRVLWAYHSVHHSSCEFNLSTSLRLSWVEGLFEWLFFVPMILIGFSPAQTLIALLVVLIYQTWPHTKKVGTLGWVDHIFNTPSVHRVHHSSIKAHLDKNNGGILIVWDRLFGTYQAEGQKISYGLVEPIGSANPLAINFQEFLKLARDVWHSRSFSEVWGYVIGRPGWEPMAKSSEQENPTRHD